MISISPVGIFLFLLLLSVTVPVACNTNSRPKGFASKSLFKSSPNNNCVIPYLSRKSTNVIAPNFRTVCTQPARVTVSPTLIIFNSPQVLVLNICPYPLKEDAFLLVDKFILFNKEQSVEGCDAIVVAQRYN